MLKSFTAQELLNWQEFRSKHEKTLKAETLAFRSGAGGKGPDAVFKDLQERVTEHNIRVISSYYTQIRLSRLAELLSLSADVSCLPFYVPFCFHSPQWPKTYLKENVFLKISTWNKPLIT